MQVALLGEDGARRKTVKRKGPMMLPLHLSESENKELLQQLELSQRLSSEDLVSFKGGLRVRGRNRWTSLKRGGKSLKKDVKQRLLHVFRACFHAEKVILGDLHALTASEALELLVEKLLPFSQQRRYELKSPEVGLGLVSHVCSL